MKRSADSVCQKCVATHTGNAQSACVRDVFTPDEFTMSLSDEELVAASQALEAVASERKNLSDEELLIASQRLEDHFTRIHPLQSIAELAILLWGKNVECSTNKSEECCRPERV